MDLGAARQTRRPRLTFSLPLDPARLLRARHRVADYLHEHAMPPDLVADVVLAVEEAMSNAVRHSGAADLEVRLGFDGADLVARVTDHGSGFDTSSFDPGRPPDPLQLGGRGLYLISQCTDELQLTADDGTDVRMVKRDALRVAAGQAPRLAVPDGEELRDVIGYRASRERSVIEEVPEGFAAIDWEYDLTFANRRGLELYGLTEEEVVGHNLWELFPGARATPLAERFEEAMELGMPSICEVDSPSLGRYLEFRIYPTSSGVSFYIRDIDDRKRTELAHEEGRRRAELLARTTARLLSAEDPQRVVEDLCLDVMQHLGCHVFFNYLVDPRAGRLVLNAWAGIDEEEARPIELLDFGVAVCGCSALQAERILAEDIQHSDDERADIVRSFGVQVYAAHPLTARGQVIGTLSFGAKDRIRFTDDELALMKTVADYVAIALDRQHAERELREREETLQSFYEGAPFLLGVSELDGDEPVAVSGNSALQRFLDAGPACFVGRTGIDAGAARTLRRELAERYRQSQRDGQPVRFERELPTDGAPITLSFAVGFIGTGGNGRPRFSLVAEDVTERRRAEQVLRARERDAAAQDERSRLARDLHDSVTQALFAASLKAEALTLSEEDLSHRTAQTIEDVRRLNRGALAQMRTMLLELRPDPLQTVPIQQLLRNLVEATESRSKVQVTLAMGGDALLAPQLHTAIYRIAQEALNNVVRHSKATRAWVELQLGPSGGHLTLRDDGQGFDASSPGPTHLGIRSMRERAAEAGGEFHLDSGPGEGTVVALDWPARHRA